MATVGQFNRVWEDHTIKLTLGGGLTDEAAAEINPLFLKFKTEFEKQFGVDIQRVDTIPQNQEITGTTLEALRAWVQRINHTVDEDFLGDDYLFWCGFRQK